MRRLAITAAASVALAVLAFFLGRWLARPPVPPAKVVDRVVTKYVDRVEYRDRVTTQVQTQERVRRVYKVITLPSGEKREETTEERGTDTKLATEGETFTARDTAAASARETLTVTLPRPSWGVAALLGWDKLQARPNIFGIVADRKLIGAVSVGAWGMRAHERWAGGLALSVRW